MATSRRVREALDRLEAAERQALAGEFLAPVVGGGSVQLRIAGVICRFKASPASFEGWGVFRATDSNSGTAELVRPARLIERRRYLDLLPLVRMIVLDRRDGTWLGTPAHAADTRFRFEGVVPLRLVEEAELFEVVLTRFDGSQCWFDGLDSRHDPGAAAYLRASLSRMIEPARLSRKGLTAEQRAAYGLRHAARLRAELAARRDRAEEQIRAALAHAGAALRDYQEADAVYRVAYEVDGRRHLSVVSQRDLSVQSAGICLSGQDRAFDLASLVGVLREAHEGGELVRTDE